MISRHVLKIRTRNVWKVNIVVKRRIGFEAFNEFPNIIQSIQTTMIDYQKYTGLPWWAVVASSTLFVRLSLFPLVRLQVIRGVGLSKAIPDMKLLTDLLIQRYRLGQRPSWNESRRLLSIYFKGIKAALDIQDFSIGRFLIYPIMNSAIFITFVYSLRQIFRDSKITSFDEGGLFWFSDLTDKDGTYALPLLAIAASYTGLVYSFYAPNNNRLILYAQDIIQTMILIALPFTIQLPSGVFCYWIPSSLISIFQTKLMRTPSARKFLGIPEP